MIFTTYQDEPDNKDEKHKTQETTNKTANNCTNMYSRAGPSGRGTAGGRIGI